MKALYEEDGGFKTGRIMSEQDASLQVESSSGKRSKIKAANVLMRYADNVDGLLPSAQMLADELDISLIWELAPQDEFSFTDFAADYYGSKASSAEQAAILVKLHGAPMYFYRKGKGRYRPAPPDTLQAALAGQEKKRLQAEEIALMAAQLVAGELPASFAPHVAHLLYKPDKNTLQYKALEQAVAQCAEGVLPMLIRCGAVPSIHDYHLGAFLFEYFPKGTGFAAHETTPSGADLPLAKVSAFSIDDAATTEIDDAFSVVFNAEGGARVGIHIAAPALGILPGSPLDKVVMDRLSTVYMPGHKITMLPADVVDHYTLAEGAARPALSLYVDVDASGVVSNPQTKLERVPVTANLRHDTLEPHFNAETLDDPTPFPFSAELHFLLKTAIQLEIGRGKADPNRQERLDYSFEITTPPGENADTGRVALIARRRGSPIDKLVAEWMIYANTHWGGWLAQHELPAIYRAQSAGKVRMTTKAEPHQGLGVPQYAWSTSPLRRAVDLLNQRQLIAALTDAPAPYPTGQDLFVPMREFDLTYNAYLSFQDRMENYWCLRYLMQENLTELGGQVLKDGQSVRLDGMPLVIRPDALPASPQGARVQVKIMGVDYFALTCHAVFVAHESI